MALPRIAVRAKANHDLTYYKTKKSNCSLGDGPDKFHGGAPARRENARSPGGKPSTVLVMATKVGKISSRRPRGGGGLFTVRNPNAVIESQKHASIAIRQVVCRTLPNRSNYKRLCTNWKMVQETQLSHPSHQRQDQDFVSFRRNRRNVVKDIGTTACFFSVGADSSTKRS